MTLDSISAHEAILEEEEEQAQANGHGEIDHSIQSPDIYYDANQNFDRICGADDFEFEPEELGMEDEEEEGMQEEDDGYKQGQEMGE